MVTAYYTETDRQWGSEELERKLQLLPLQMKQRILRYTDWQQRQLRICGKLLLQKVLSDTGSAKTLDDVRYDIWNKPYIPGGWQFNIAHSGNIAICAITDGDTVGIDIEKVQNIDIDEMQDYFTANEWKWLQDSKDKSDAFCQLWVRKESLLKAIGRGVDIPFSSIDAMDNKVIFDETTFFIHDINIEVDYKISYSNELINSELNFYKISEKELR